MEAGLPAAARKIKHSYANSIIGSSSLSSVRVGGGDALVENLHFNKQVPSVRGGRGQICVAALFRFPVDAGLFFPSSVYHLVICPPSLRWVSLSASHAWSDRKLAALSEGCCCWMSDVMSVYSPIPAERRPPLRGDVCRCALNLEEALRACTPSV